jgi:acyl-CoA thioesterase FadM
MNLYFRLLWVLLKANFSPAIAVNAKSSLTFRVWPTDCDINFHLTNARYFSFMDLGRMFYVGQIKLLGKLLKRRWMPVVGSCEITFIRPIKPWQKINLTTELITWDEKYQYFYQRFTWKGKTYATALVKTAAYANRQAVPSEKIIALTGTPMSAPLMPESIKLFRELTQLKRKIHG